MEFQDIWTVQRKERPDGKVGPTKDDHVSGHARGDHAYCSASNCDIAQRCIDDQHDQCSRETCVARDDHHFGMHHKCKGTWCKVAAAEEDAFYDAMEAAGKAGTLETFEWNPDKYLITDSDDSDDNIIFEQQQKEQHEAGNHSNCSIKYCDKAFKKNVIKKFINLDGV